MDNFISIIDKILPLVGVVVGIVATKLSDLLLDSRRNFNRNVETRRDEDVLLIEKTIFEILEGASEYWSNNSDSEENQRSSISVYAKMSFLGALIWQLFEHHEIEWLIASEAYWEFHESCTGSEYFGSNREPILIRIQDIELSSYQLVANIKSLRRNLPYEKVKRWRI